MRSEAQKAVVAQRQTVDLELTNSREEHGKRLAAERATQEREISDMRTERPARSPNSARTPMRRSPA